uniref:Uncharacterized protein n=1 Tax=Daucus carota subsp. sativus TaxID=79200 RepID=A0A162AL24_DAUCS
MPYEKGILDYLQRHSLEWTITTSNLRAERTQFFFHKAITRRHNTNNITSIIRGREALLNLKGNIR